MTTPTGLAYDAAMHTVHYLYQTRVKGLKFSSVGNLEPVCYYDSGFNQRQLSTHPQYGFVIYWCGAPIVWRSKRCAITPNSVSQAEFQCLRHAWSFIKWVREVLRDLGLEEWVRRPTLCIGDNRNARDWANEKVISEGNQHLDRHYFTIRERVRSGEILPVWIEGKHNPADVMTKAIDKTVTDELTPYLCGEEEIPLPDGMRVWFGPPDKPVLRGNKSGRRFGVITPPNQNVIHAQGQMEDTAATDLPTVDMEPEPEATTSKPVLHSSVAKHRQVPAAAPRRSRRVAGHAPTPLSAGMRKLGNTLVTGLHPTRKDSKSWMDEHKRYWETISAAKQLWQPSSDLSRNY